MIPGLRKIVPSEGGDKAFTCISRDHMIKSHVTRLVRYLHPKVTVRATELNNKNVYVLKIRASLCYQLGQFYYKSGKRCYKLGQLH